jgi:hypothetical protein
LTSRFFVLYQSGAIKGLCLRAKADSERGSTNADGSYPKYDFLAREDAYGTFSHVLTSFTLYTDFPIEDNSSNQIKS